MSGKFAARITGGKQNDAGSRLADPVSLAYGLPCATMGQKKLRRSGVSWVATGILAVLLAAPTLSKQLRRPVPDRAVAHVLSVVSFTVGVTLISALQDRLNKSLLLAGQFVSLAAADELERGSRDFTADTRLRGRPEPFS